MDSVKWLRRIVVLGPDDRPDAVYASGMNTFYGRVIDEGGKRRIGSPVSEILVRSNVAFPLPGSNLATGEYTVWGFAWGGKQTIARVEVSFDAGESWSPTKLETIPKAFAWTKWSFRWKALPGNHVLLSRATDSEGSVQPLTRDPHRLDGYELNWCRPVSCSVR
jgi:hypothetical protein